MPALITPNNLNSARTWDQSFANYRSPGSRRHFRFWLPEVVFLRRTPISNPSNRPPREAMPGRSMSWPNVMRADMEFHRTMIKPLNTSANPPNRGTLPPRPASVLVTQTGWACHRTMRKRFSGITRRPTGEMPWPNTLWVMPAPTVKARRRILMPPLCGGKNPPNRARSMHKVRWASFTSMANSLATQITSTMPRRPGGFAGRPNRVMRRP